jgi:serine/threonine-protein kinase
MGEVYRATDTRLGRDVALKVLPAEMAASPERLERFQREARALAALDHPGIVTVYSVEEHEGVHFLTMQLVEGEPLDRVIPEDGLPLERVFAIAGALAEALNAARRTRRASCIAISNRQTSWSQGTDGSRSSTSGLPG